MRRTTVLLALALCGAAVALLFLFQSQDHGRADRREGPSPGGVAETAGEPAEAKRAAAVQAAVDDDPNRVPGPDLVLRGRVVRAGAPVAGATVTVSRANPARADNFAFRWQMRQHQPPPPLLATAESGDDGGFEVRVARRSRLILSAFRSGAGSASLSLLMPAEGDPPEVTLALEPGAVVRGEVVDTHGAAVAGAQVLLQTNSWSEPVRETGTAADAQGRFEFADVAAGDYALVARSPRHPAVRTTASVPAQSFVRIELHDAGVIAGTVLDGRGEAIAGAAVYLSTNDGLARAEADASGAYRAEIAPGPIMFAAVEHPRVGWHAAGPDGFPLLAAVVKPGEELRYDIRLRPGVPLRGRVVFAGTGAPAPGASVALLRLAAQWRGLSDVDLASAGDDGRFEFPYVTEGTYALEAKAEGAARMVVRYAQQGQPFTIDLFVDGESPPPEQRLEVQPAGAVRGVLLGAEDRRGASVNTSVNLETEVGSLYTQPDDLGAFVFEHVPPMENAVVQSYGPQAKSEPFRVVAGETAEVVLDPAAQGGVPVIVEDDQGSPVARARVMLVPEQQLRQDLQNFLNSGWATDRTDEAGRATASSAQWTNDYYRGQNFVVVAQREGYETAFSKGVKLSEAGAGETARIVLRRGGTVRGRVEFAGGGPVVNIWVSLSPKRDPALGVDARTALTAYTGFDGSFEIEGVGAGTYMASTSHPDGKAESREVAAGDEDVRLVIQPALSIAGVVVYEDGRPVANARVTVMVPRARGESPYGGVTAANGRFRIGRLDPGAYAVLASPNRQQGWVSEGFEEKRVEGVAAGTEDLEIVVAGGPRVLGRVEDARGNGLAGAAVVALAPAGRVSSNPWNEQRPTAVTNGRGEFELKGLDAAEVELLVLAQEQLPATQKAVAGGAPVTVRLQPGAVIEGRILRSDGTPLARQWLTVQPADQAQMQRQSEWQQRAGQAWWYYGGQTGTGRTDGEGRFHVGSLLPGEYRLFLSVGGEVLLATTLRTDAAPVTLRLQRALTIRGRVVDTDGRPVVLAEPNRVWLSAQAGQNWLPGAAAEADGTFEISGVPAGTVTLQVWAGNEYKPAKVEIAAGRDDVVIVLERNVPPPPPPGR